MLNTRQVDIYWSRTLCASALMQVQVSDYIVSCIAAEDQNRRMAVNKTPARPVTTVLVHLLFLARQLAKP
ncbi:hypothetical protein LMH87_006338 [Akanthomyces muscarius]|uniref:Uncharacterized protein n=1 Tax=Akanthomyces muscarius TaxID=2231603 RepID=A0A9W8QPE2_AKAMU|nr:hypothetical protein LMH87_006338 [Akanthomyces muscarius]KAJ4164675.1 hypothetical protein LMH87_006338 [Akanthomyces muscarius]